MNSMQLMQGGGAAGPCSVSGSRIRAGPPVQCLSAREAAPSSWQQRPCCHLRRDGGGRAVHAAAQQQEGSLRPIASAAMAESLALNLPWDEQSKGHVVKSQGLHRAPLSGGVKTATTRFDLPTPPVAVRNLVELARFGNLSTVMSGMHHRRAGYPFGTLVDFAVDGAGHPVFCLSPLALHSRNVLEEPRASLVVQMPGWTGLANARVTIFGDIYQLPAEMQGAARDIFFAKHSAERKERWVSGNWVYFRMNRIVDIYFVGGFGTVQWIDPQEYLGSRPDDVVLDNPTRTLQELSALFEDQLKVLIKPMLKNPQAEIEEVVFISIDASGVDVRIRVGSEFNVERISFGERVTSAVAAKDALRRLLANGVLSA